MSWNDRRGWSAQPTQASTARPGFGQGYEHNQTHRPARVDNSGWSSQGDQRGTSGPGWNSTQALRRVDYDREEPHSATNPRKWTGAVTELMPPNYGIVDHIGFYHSDVVEGPLPQAIGEVVDCEAIPNVDGGKYEWRLIKVTLSRSGRTGLAPPAHSQPAPTRFAPPAVQAAAAPYNRAPPHAAPAPVHAQPHPRAAPQLRTAGATPARRSGFDRGPPAAPRPEMLDDDIAARPPPARAPAVPVRAPVATTAPAPLAVPKQLGVGGPGVGGGYRDRPDSREPHRPGPERPMHDRSGPTPDRTMHDRTMHDRTAPDREPRRPAPLPRERMDAPRYDRDPATRPRHTTPPRDPQPRDTRPREPRDNTRDRDPPPRDTRDSHLRNAPPPRDRGEPRDARDGEGLRSGLPPDMRSGRESGDGRPAPLRLSGSSAAADRVVSPSRGAQRTGPNSGRFPPGGYVMRLAKEAVHIYDRNLQSIVARYDKLYVPSEFMRCCALWLSLFSGPKRPLLDHPVRFEIAAAPPPTNPIPTPRSTISAGNKTNAGTSSVAIKKEASTKEASTKEASAKDSTMKDATTEETGQDSVAKEAAAGAAAAAEAAAAAQKSKPPAPAAAAPVKEEPAAAVATVYTVKPKDAVGQGVEVRVNEDKSTVEVKITEAEKSFENRTGTPENEQNDEEMVDADDNNNTHNKDNKDSVEKSPSMRKTTRKSAAAAASPGRRGKGSRGGKKSNAAVDEGEKDYYKSLKVAQLRAELSRRDLPIKGNKAELVVRLESYDTAQEHERATTEGAADVDSPMGDAEVGAEGGKGDREMTVEDEGDEENKLADDPNKEKTPDAPAATPMDVDMADAAGWPTPKEDTPVDTTAANPSATLDALAGQSTPAAGGGLGGRGSKRSRRNSWARDDSAEHAQHIDTAASTECEDDPLGETGAGEEPRATTTPSPAPNPPAPTQTTTTRPSFKRELVPSHAAAAAAVATSAKPAAGIGAFVGAAPGELWTAKVMLMGGFAHSTLHAETARQFKHQLDLPFLVRKRAKGELQLLGGSWTPQDGGHPEKDPGALIRTAIRTVKEQCGVDLSGAGEWTKLVELQFRRPLKDIEAKIRLEASNASSNIPPPSTEMTSLLKSAAENNHIDAPARGNTHAGPPDMLAKTEGAGLNFEVTAMSTYVVQRTIVFVVSAASVGEPDANVLAEISNAKDATQKVKTTQAELDTANATLAEHEAAVKTIAVALAEKGQAGGKGGAALPSLPDNPSSLTVADLQSELKKHGLETDWDPAKGKSVLVDRLTSHVKTALQSNKEAAALLEQHTAASEKLQVVKGFASTMEEEHSKASEAATAAQKILDHPPPTTVLRAKPLTETDNLKTLSLDQLLDYTPNDTKECVFEVSMAAEAFLELLHMHYGRVLLASAAHISKAESVLRAAAKTEDELRRLEKEERASKERGGKDGKPGATDDKTVVTQEVSAGMKRKAESSPPDARTTLTSVAKRRRAEVESLMHCSVAVATGAPTPTTTPGLPAGAKTSNGAIAAKDEAFATEIHAETESILLAGRFFDEAGSGYIEAQDLEDIIHNCYPYSSRRWVRSVVEEMSRYGKLKYNDYALLKVQYYPALLPPAGASAPAAYPGDTRGLGGGCALPGDGAAATNGSIVSVPGGGMVEVDGAVVDVMGLKKASEESKCKLAEQSGMRACAEAAATEAKVEAAKLKADLDASVKLNLTLREEVGKLKDDKIAAEASATKAQTKLDAIMNAMK